MKKPGCIIITPLLEQRVSKICYSLVQMGFSPLVVAGEIRRDLFDQLLQGITVRVIPGNRWKAPIPLKREARLTIKNLLSDYSKNCGCTIIMVRDMFWSWEVGRIVKKIHPSRLIVVTDIADNYDLSHDLMRGMKRQFVKFITGMLLRRVLTYSDFLLVVCSLNEDRIRQEYSPYLRNTRILVLKNFPLLQPMKPAKRKIEKSLVYVGRVDEISRDLFFVFRCISRSPQWTLHLYSAEKVETISRLKKLAKQMRMDHRVVFHQPVPYHDLRSELSQYQVGLVPHKRNLLTDYTVPNKIYDYRTAELPVLMSDNPSLMAENRDNRYGLVYRTGQERDFIDKLEKICKFDTDTDLSAISWDKEFRVQMGEIVKSLQTGC